MYINIYIFLIHQNIYKHTKIHTSLEYLPVEPTLTQNFINLKTFEDFKRFPF